MAYGEGLKKLNPLSDEQIIAALRQGAPNAEILLDLACGRGDRLKTLADTLPTLKLFGIDADAENAEAAAEKCPAAEICFGSAETLPYADCTFDAVLCECSLSLFLEPKVCAEEIARVLCPGGVLLLGDLYAKRDVRAAEKIADNDTVKTVYGREVLEDYFASGFYAEAFTDCSGDLTQMLGQMLMDGVLCDCLNTEALMQMKRLGTGYGLWLFRKQNRGSAR
jgi:ubiquinone/menaquinone biosynthesis C-methylase UbiE